MTKNEADWAVEDLKRQGFDGWVEQVAKHSNGYAAVMRRASDDSKRRMFFSRDEVKAFLRGVA